ncbi:MAG TPA: hypothetical protein DDZ88_01970 [Verrucomicrobiales bacterium]|nr:hypothetical protein [Verrucomicrobiales bacterium]
MSMMTMGVGRSGAATKTTEDSPMDELLFQQEGKAPLFVTDINDEVKRFFARHPERLHDLAPRKFEILIADILKDLGFETQLTQATRDGGRDIYAFIRNAATSFLMFVECKNGRITSALKSCRGCMELVLSIMRTKG